MAKSQDIFWIHEAQTFMLGCALLMMELGLPDEVNMTNLVNMCLDYGRGEKLSELYKLEPFIHPDSIAAMNLKGALIKSAEKTQQSVFVSLFAIIKIFTIQKDLVEMLSSSSFNMRDIVKKKTAVFLVVPDEKDTYIKFLKDTGKC